MTDGQGSKLQPNILKDIIPFQLCSCILPSHLLCRGAVTSAPALLALRCSPLDEGTQLAFRELQSDTNKFRGSGRGTRARGRVHTRLVVVQDEWTTSTLHRGMMRIHVGEL